MEKSVCIKTPGNHVVWGTLQLPKRKTSTLVVFVHGLTGYSNEPMFYNGARFLSQKGFASYRFDLYGEAPKTRRLQDCGISTHAGDLNAVFKYFRKKYKKIFVVGHSLGGLVILASDVSLVDGIIFWDATCRMLPEWKDKYYKYNARLGKYLTSWSMQFVMSKKMYREWAHFPLPNVAVKKVHKPIKVIVAAKGILVKAGKEYYKYAQEPKEFSSIKGAWHSFHEGETQKDLFKETLSFIRKFR